MIRQSGPLKLRECLASGKPTVSVDIPEVRLLEPHVRVAADQAAFLAHVADALAEPPGTAVHARQQAVRADGWDRRAALLRSVLDGCRPRVDPVCRRCPGIAGSGSSHTARPAPANGLRHGRRAREDPAQQPAVPQRCLSTAPRLHPAGGRSGLRHARACRQMGVDLLDIPERGPADLRTLWRLVVGSGRFSPPHPARSRLQDQRPVCPARPLVPHLG